MLPTCLWRAEIPRMCSKNGLIPSRHLPAAADRSLGLMHSCNRCASEHEGEHVHALRQLLANAAIALTVHCSGLVLAIRCLPHQPRTSEDHAVYMERLRDHVLRSTR